MLLFHANYQNMTMELRTGSPESKLSPTLPGCSVLYPVLQVMVNENSDAAWMDGWMDTLEAQQQRNCACKIKTLNFTPIPLKVNTASNVH